MSTNRSHLTPTPITDKNGVATVRWTKPATAAKIKAPLPAVVAPQNTEQLLDDVTSLLAEPFIWKSNHPEDNAGLIFDTHRHNLSSFSPETLLRIKNKGLNETRAMQIADLINNGWGEAETNDFISLVDFFDQEDFYGGDVLWFMEYLPHYEGITPATANDYPEERSSQINAIVAITYDMQLTNNSFLKAIKLKPGSPESPAVPDDLYELLLNPEYDREAVVRVVRERSVYDAETIKHLIDSGVTTPLGDGVI
jgi:hypothetical protein